MIEQIMIGLLSVTAVFLSQDTRQSWRRWACIFGMCSQPFWFYATYKAGQWGIFALCWLYAFSWMRGIYNNWLRPAAPVAMGDQQIKQVPLRDSYSQTTHLEEERAVW